MAFPAIAATATTNGTTATTNPVVNLPSGTDPLVIVLFRLAATGTVTFPAGWTIFANETADGSDDRIVAAWADSPIGATVTLVTSVSAKFAALAWRIAGADNPAIRPPETSVQVGNSTTPDPPTTTPTGGAKDYLWLACGGWEGEQTSPPGTFPAGYTLNQIGANSGTAGAITTNCRVAGAGRQFNASSENPGTFTISVADDWTCFTIAVHPGVTNRRGRVSWAELETPSEPRRGQLSWAELEAPNEPRRGQLSWAEFETPNAPRRGQVSWGEFEVPNLNSRAQVSWAEFEVPNVVANRRAQISWGELEIPDAGGAVVLLIYLKTESGKTEAHASFALAKTRVETIRTDRGFWTPENPVATPALWIPYDNIGRMEIVDP